MNTLIPFLLLAALAAAILRSHRTRPAAPVCAACGRPPARGDCPSGPGWQCPACVTRRARTASLALTAELDRQAARRRAAARAAIAEAERIAHRHTVVRVGTVAPGPHGPLFDGWVFQDPHITAGSVPPDARAVPLSGFYRPGELICGWTPAELHHLAHGQTCRCLTGQTRAARRIYGG
jgi:hypothetical protein